MEADLLFFKVTLAAWLGFLALSALGTAGYSYRPGLDINVPLIEITAPELR